MRSITLVASLLFLLTCLLTACGSPDDTSKTLAQPIMFGRVEVIVKPTSHAEPSMKVYINSPADAQRLYRNMQEFPYLPKGKTCDLKKRNSYQITFFSPQQTIRAVANQTDCGTAVFSQGDTRPHQPDHAFWNYLHRLVRPIDFRPV